ncbi:ras guanine nucleotide exchange factor domain-containing protein [Vararia minispora EC-137]|uniref:Ras guanine nucleotide exchange factor domain-containing protein n=1 Tax=Vararia minispora EC-137 TaxID=1314806 RepID=A0ACB8QHJ4_9AGAM|nr:ras guanine nucleotide exchange factor domain-containing protein [Vararia minispora EC-137]
MSIVSPMPSTNTSTSSLMIPLVPETSSITSIASSSKAHYTLPQEPAPLPEYVLAMHDFVPDHKNATCLSFRAGQVIHVLNRDPSGWWDGELDGMRGWFPSNYVNGDLGLLVDDDAPLSRQPEHSRSHSVASPSSFVSSTPSRQGPFSRSDYCPPLMVPLLHALSLLQSAVRSNRVAHFQPSVACIISCVRSILAAAECLSREAPFLRRFPLLAAERKRVLSDLAAIVTQAKRASSDDIIDEDERDVEVAQMVRLGGQVFSRVRRFLAVAVQCGVDLPDKEVSVEYPSFAAEAAEAAEVATQPFSTVASPTVTKPDTIRLVGGEDTFRAAPWRKPTPRKKVRDRPSTPGKAKSMGDLRSSARSNFLRGAEPVPSLPTKRFEQPQNLPSEHAPPSPPHALGHQHAPSTSSTVSSSSLSSLDSVGTPITPPFPTGPSSIEELTDALRHTHDQYLSAIAAFIGHAHSHTRSSHASSTGHAYELVKEIVQTVCRLLTIVEAVLRHPAVPPHKATGLRTAKDALFDVITGLADSVRNLTKPLPPSVSEAQEMAALIRAATDAVKVGADCVGAVKVCLARSSTSPEKGVAKPFIISFPHVAEADAPPFSPRQFLYAHHNHSPHLARSASEDGLRARMGDEDEDPTMKALPPIQVSVPSDSEATRLPSIPNTPLRSPRPPPLNVVPPTEGEPVQPDILSPTSISSRPEDDATTWEGSSNHARMLTIEESIVEGDGAPPVPSAPPPQDLDSWIAAHDYPAEDVAYNKDGHLVGATLPALVEKMTPHSSITDAAFSAVFFLTFRLFSSPAELVQALIDRYNLLPPPGITEQQMYVWQQCKGLPVRLRVSNFVKTWLDIYWRLEADSEVLPLLHDFNRDALAHMFPGPAARIHDMIILRMTQARERETQNNTLPVPATPRPDRSRDAGMPLNPPVVNSPSEIPRPIMTKPLLAALRRKDFASISVTDFDPLELARQMTLMECALFCAITPEEVLDASGEPALNVRKVTSLSTVVTGWVAECILNESDTKRRVGLVKFFIKVADIRPVLTDWPQRCTSLNNFSTSRSILAALDSSTIARLHQTWAGVAAKHKTQIMQLEAARKLADHARNYREYRTALRNTAPPAVPFLGLYLTDLTFCREGNPSHRTSPIAADKKLINFNKYHKMARIVQDLQRFQVPYTFQVIPEVQTFLHDAFERSKHHGDLQDLYRRSLLVEPKQLADTPPASDARSVLFPWSKQTPTPIVAA